MSAVFVQLIEIERNVETNNPKKKIKNKTIQVNLSQIVYIQNSIIIFRYKKETFKIFEFWCAHK